ncbi:hypothetical protein PR003_g7416 [Phytophthora rubi]|uniref:Pectate lyase n=1 Tax=Phytophthora rubi TaxID=129364 RepID=A0A6A4FLT4_9STRA|nr:hypothetical protein PR003_g7416 [Phytophthora rubi]
MARFFFHFACYFAALAQSSRNQLAHTEPVGARTIIHVSGMINCQVQPNKNSLTLQPGCF